MREYPRRLRLVVWNKARRRLRAPFRIYAFFLVYAILLIFVASLSGRSETGIRQEAGLRLLLSFCSVGLIIGAARVLDRRPVHTFGLQINRQWIMDGLAGVILGIAIPTGTTLIGLAGGWLVVGESLSPLTIPLMRKIGLALVVAGCIAVTEELVFRGYILTNAIEGADLQWLSPPVTITSAWGLSALLFAFSHSISSVEQGLHFLGAGLLLGLAYLLTGQLALPIGIHTGFNFAAGYVFSTVQDPSVVVVPLTVQGPAWLIGQTGVVQTSLQLPAALLILVYAWWRTGSIGISPESYKR